MTRSLRTLAGGGALLLALVVAELFCHRPGELTSIDSDFRLELFVGLECVAAVLYFGLVWLVLRLPGSRRGLLVVLALAALMRVAPLAWPPFLSSDLFRYVWDGRVQALGINPYRYIPGDPALKFMQDPEIFGHTNRSEEARTIYPPAAQVIFAAVGQVWSSVMGIKVAMTLFEAVAIGAMTILLRQAGLAGERVLIYAWNPLPIWEYAGNAHIDAASMAFIALSLIAVAARRQALAGGVLALAVLCKFLPAALAPAFWRRWDWRFVVAGGITVVALYAVYASAGRYVLGFLPGYAAEEGLETGSGFVALRWLAHLVDLPTWANSAYLAVVGAGLLALAASFAFGPALPEGRAARIRVAGRQAAVLATATTLALSPHYPWYFGWVGLLACLAPYRSIVFLSASGVLLYLDPYHREDWVSLLVYGPPLALAALDIISAIRRTPSTGSGRRLTEVPVCPPPY